MKILCKKLKSALLFIVTVIRRVFCCWRRRKKSEDFSPSSIIIQKNPADVNYSQWSGDTDQWNSWREKPFTNVVEEKIEEYRKIMVGSREQPEAEEPDYFNDMEPELKHARKAYVGSLEKEKKELHSRTNLFAFNANEIPPVLPSGELGLLEEKSENEAENWDDSLDIGDVDVVLREQRAKERREKQIQRRMEHEKRLLGKRKIEHA